MKKLTLILSLLLAVACMATACADNSDAEPPAGSPPADGGILGDTTDPEVSSPTSSVAETESETSPAENSRYFQFPLTDANDTTSYVSLPDGTTEGYKAIEFFVQPTDTDTQELVSAFRLILIDKGPSNVQIISFKAGQTYGFIYMLENAYIDRPEGVETQFVRMECSSINFRDSKTETTSGRYYVLGGGDTVNFRYTAQQRKSILSRYRHTNQAALDRAEDLINKYSDAETYEYTVLYSYIDGVETVSTPVESIPEFPFAIFNEYGFDN